MVPTLAVALLLAGVAQADVITLDNGGVLVGDLGMYQFGGDCHITVTEGPLVGVAVTVPCRRVASFEKTAPIRTNVAVPLPADELTAVATIAVAPVSAPPVTAPPVGTREEASPAAPAPLRVAAPVGALPLAAAPVAAPVRPGTRAPDTVEASAAPHPAPHAVAAELGPPVSTDNRPASTGPAVTSAAPSSVVPATTPRPQLATSPHGRPAAAVPPPVETQGEAFQAPAERFAPGPR